MKKVNENKKKVLVGGCFDVLHFGHLTFLKNAKKLGNFLIVALESDEFIKKNKKKIPVHTQKQRAEILSSLDFVDQVIYLPYLKSDEDYALLTKKIKPDVIAITKGDPHRAQKEKQAKEIGAKVVVASPKLKKFASSKIAPYATFLSD